MRNPFNIMLFIASIFPLHLYANSELGNCEKVFAVSASALSNKAKGVSKETLSGALPPLSSNRESEPLKSMREIVNEIYSYEIRDEFVYSVYRTELCVRREAGKKVPENYSEVQEALTFCTILNHEQKASCAMKAAGSSPDKNT